MQRVSGIIQQANCDLRCLQYLQEQGLMASAPIGCNEPELSVPFPQRVPQS